MLHKLVFLGQRNYIQGPTLFDVLAKNLSGGEVVSFKVNRPITSDQIEVATTLRADGTKPDAEGAIVKGGLTRHWYAWSAPMSATPVRVAYDESPVTQSAQWAEQSVSLSRLLDQSVCTTLVSMNKALLHQVFPQKRMGRWIFCEVRFSDYALAASNFVVRVKRTVAGGRLVASEFAVGEACAGELLFAWGE